MIGRDRARGASHGGQQMRVERQVLFWGAALLVLVVAIGVLRDILLPFVAGATLAYFLNPLADRLTRLGLRRSWGSPSSSRSARSCSLPCSSSSSSPLRANAAARDRAARRTRTPEGAARGLRARTPRQQLPRVRGGIAARLARAGRELGRPDRVGRAVAGTAASRCSTFCRCCSSRRSSCSICSSTGTRCSRRSTAGCRATTRRSSAASATTSTTPSPPSSAARAPCA